MRNFRPYGSRRSHGAVGPWCVAFGIGLLASLICPTELILILLALALIAVGWKCC